MSDKENSVVTDAPLEQVDQVAIIEADDVRALIDCPRCKMKKTQSKRSPHMCVDCEKAENNRIIYYRQHQEGWMDVAKEAGLDLWQQQPGETQWEFTIWTAYRDTYPGKYPRIVDVARQLGTTYTVVNKVSQRWNFPVRMQAWMKHCDDLTLMQRRQEVLDMNKQHVDMASRLRAKLSDAIDQIEPALLKPSEIGSLAKLAAELERKARLDTIDQEALRRDMHHEVENPNLKKSPTKANDLSEVVGILLKAGALGDITTIGVKETKTTQVVVGDGNGNMSGVEMSDT